VWPAELVRDPSLAPTLRRQRVDLLLNVHSLFILHRDIVEAPAIGSFNLHPGPLPHYAGLNAPSWAILEGEREHAVTLHWMAAGIDTGPVAYEARFPLTEEDTGLSVSAKCVQHGLPLVARLLLDAERGAVPRHEQEPAERRYFDGNPPYNGGLPWTLPARRIVDLVRAADYRPFRSPWGHPGTNLDGEALHVLQASCTGDAATEPPGTIGEPAGPGVRVAAGDEWVLVRRLQRGEAAVDATAVLRTGARLD
jgi:methionyl-tRNA formyltransferase